MRFLNERGRSLLALWTLCTVGACDASVASELPPSGADGSASGSCASLGACCQSLPSEVVTSCTELAAEASATECAEELAALGKLCAPAASSKRDGGMIADATTVGDAGLVDAGAVACTLLSSCCTSASIAVSDVAQCQSIQASGAESDCTAELAQLVASNECAGVVEDGATTVGTCPDLQACCGSPSLPATFSTACLSTAMNGLNDDCTSELSTFEAAGYCLPDGGHGHPVDPNCATLSMCCGEVTFPAGTLSTCQSLASANVGGSCLSAYDSYSALGYCE
jgi:hypothetical protein